MSDLTQATRELFLRSLVDEVYMRTPILEEIKRRNKVTYSGGKYIERLVDTDTIDDLVQEYSVNDALTDQKKNTLDKPRFTWKYAQLPLRYDADEKFQNVTAGNEEQLLDLAAHLTEKGQDGVRKFLCKKIFNSGSTTGVADGATGFQSLVSALDHDVTYGTLARAHSTNTRNWWQGADPGGLTSTTTSAQGTAYNATISNLRKWINETDVAHYMQGADDLQVVCCPTLYNKFRAEMESKLIYKPESKQKQGITSMELDGHEIVSVPYLQTTSTMKTWLFILNLRYFELYIHSARNFDMTEFKWQGDVANGHDYWLSRIMWIGNFVCWKPNSSMFLSNIS